jgi:DNA-binding LytR/AlgR family response regulator
MLTPSPKAFDYHNFLRDVLRQSDSREYFLAEQTDLAKGMINNIENTLEELEEKLGPSLFFRANRQFIVAREAIYEIEFYLNGRLSLKAQPLAVEKILVSKERVPVFTKWFEVV